MSELRIWLSILAWAAFAILVSAGACKIALSVNPDISYGLLALIALFAVQAAYGVRVIARRLGLARKSYAPDAAA